MSDHQIAIALGTRSRGSLPVGNPAMEEVRAGIHDLRRLYLTDGRSVLVKHAKTADTSPMLLEEAVGLNRLAAHVSVPKILAQGEDDEGRAWLALEWLQLQKMGNAEFLDLGRQLAVLHGVTKQRHGLSRCNFVGMLPQDNAPMDTWQEFFVERRLRPLLRLLESKGHPQPESEILAAAELLLAGHNPRPALLHGNLSYWNVGPVAGGRTVFFGPAPYYGDPEIDLVRLGVDYMLGSKPFLLGYGELPEGFHLRRPLYLAHREMVRVGDHRGEYLEYKIQRLEHFVRELLETAGELSGKV